MNFFIKTSKGVFGPFTQEQIRLNVKQGRIKSHHLISSSKTGDFQKITKEFLSGEHGSLSSRSESPPELGSGNSFDNPTNLQLPKPKKLRNTRKPKSRRELLEGSSIASTPAHAFSHRSNMEARFANLNKAAKNNSSKGQLLGFLMFVFLGGLFFMIFSVISSYSESIDNMVQKNSTSPYGDYEFLKQDPDELRINADGTSLVIKPQKITIPISKHHITYVSKKGEKVEADFTIESWRNRQFDFIDEDGTSFGKSYFENKVVVKALIKKFMAGDFSSDIDRSDELRIDSDKLSLVIKPQKITIPKSKHHITYVSEKGEKVEADFSVRSDLDVTRKFDFIDEDGTSFGKSYPENKLVVKALIKKFMAGGFD